MGWFTDEPVAGEPAEPGAEGKVIHVAVLALRYGDDVGISWSWACNGDREYALGYAVANAPSNAVIMARTVIAIPLAAGVEADLDAAGEAKP